MFTDKTDAEAETPIFGHLMQRTDSLEKTLMLGKIEGRRRRGQLRTRWLDDISDSMDEFQQTPGDGEERRVLECCSPQARKVLDTTEQLKSNNKGYLIFTGPGSSKRPLCWRNSLW